MTSTTEKPLTQLICLGSCVPTLSPRPQITRYRYQNDDNETVLVRPIDWTNKPRNRSRHLWWPHNIWTNNKWHTLHKIHIIRGAGVGAIFRTIHRGVTNGCRRVPAFLCVCVTFFVNATLFYLPVGIRPTDAGGYSETSDEIVKIHIQKSMGISGFVRNGMCTGSGNGGWAVVNSAIGLQL